MDNKLWWENSIARQQANIVRYSQLVVTHPDPLWDIMIKIEFEMLERATQYLATISEDWNEGGNEGGNV